MRTSSCIATLALRIRVSMSAIGSVSIRHSSPAGLGHAGHLAGVDEFAQAHAAQAELAEHGTGTATTAAACVRAHLVLGLRLRLVDQSLLGHGSARLHFFLPTGRPLGPRPEPRRVFGGSRPKSTSLPRLNGKPKASSSALPPSSSVALVTMVMSIPRWASILS